LDSRQWLPLLAILFIFGLIFRIPLLAVFSSMLLVVIGLASWWQRHSLDGVIYKRRPYYRRSFPGEEVPLTLEVENRKLLPISWLRVRDPWPKAIGPEDEEVLAPTHIPTEGLLTNVFSLRWYERARRKYTLLFRKRGKYSVGPVRLESGDLFGLYEKFGEQGPVEIFTVFPSLLPFRDLDLPAEDPFGDRRSRRRLYEDPNQPIGVRDYHPEDSFRRVHWPATAHTGELQVKVYQPTSANVMVVCLNVSTFPRHWEGTYPELLEHVVKVAATLVDKGIQEGYRVGLISNGCLAHADQPFRIPPGRSPKQLATLLEALAGVTPVVTSPFERFLIKEVPRLPYGATLLIVTGITTPELAETLLKLRQKGRQITLLSFARQPPPEIQGIRIFHHPFEESESGE
jgi:uncharacterized protein (DUF58 family)